MAENQTETEPQQNSEWGEFKGSFSTGEKVETQEEPKVEQPSAEAPKVDEPEKPTKEVPNEEPIEYWKTYAEKSGLEFQSEDEFIETLQRYKSLNETVTQLQDKAKNYEGLDPLALDLDRAAKSGMDLNLYLEARNLDPAILGEKESLRKQFELQNAELVKADPEFAKMKFEKDFNAKFGILNKKLDELEAEEMAGEIEYTKRSLKAESELAKRYLQDWKAKNVTIPEAKQVPDQEVVAQRRDEYYQQADTFVDAIDTIDIDLGDEKVFKYGLSDYKDSIKQDLRNPLETLRTMGVDIEKGTIDAEKFGEFLAIQYAFNGIAKPLSDFVIESRNKELVTSKVKPEPPQPTAGGAPEEMDHDMKVALAFEKKRQAEMAQAL